MDMKTILVATDFSPSAVNASKYAVDMAMGIHAGVLLFYACQVPVSYAEVPVVIDVNELVNEGEERLSKLKDQLLTRTDHTIQIETLVKEGAFFNELDSICEQVRPYVVIMGSQGTTQAERFLFGSHTVYAMKNLSWPLLTVPWGSRFSDIKKIGLACDFDKVAQSIPTDELKLLVKDFDARLLVLNTGKREEFNPDIVFESGLLQEMIRELKPEYHFITHNDTDKGILEFVEKNNIDLLVVLPKRRRLLEQVLHKSHTRKFVMHSHVPVMALH